MEEQVLTLYSTHCIRCNLVKQMLDVHNVSYQEINDKQIMAEKGFESAPVLEVGDRIIEDYSSILSWLSTNGYYSLTEETYD